MNKSHQLYFIQEHLREPYQNGGIGFTDAERILIAENYRPIFLPCHYNFSFAAKIRRFFSVLKTVLTLPSGSLVIILLPQYAVMNKWMAKLLGWRKSVKRIALLGDINGIKHNDQELLKKELRQFSGYDYLIVHNQWMKNWVTDHLPDARCSMLHFFDFLTMPKTDTVVQEYNIAYAGNLEEAGFLGKTGELSAQNGSILFRIYGEPYTGLMAVQPNQEYMGTSDPYDLVQKLQASYGLIWYGDSLDSVQGNIGPYLSLISPHKASLYLLCGMPLIVPEGTAIAGLVKQYKCGIVAGSLHKLQAIMETVGPTEYKEMCNNARNIAGKLATGEGLRNALLEMKKALRRGPSQ